MALDAHALGKKKKETINIRVWPQRVETNIRPALLNAQGRRLFFTFLRRNQHAQACRAWHRPHFFAQCLAAALDERPQFLVYTIVYTKALLNLLAQPRYVKAPNSDSENHRRGMLPIAYSVQCARQTPRARQSRNNPRRPLLKRRS